MSYCLAPSPPLVHGSQRLLSDEGVQQGDPLEPMLYAIATHEIARRAVEMEGVVWGVWYLDDGILVGSPEALIAALTFLREKLLELNLKVNTRKCVMWSPGVLEAPSADTNEIFVPWSKPITVLGCPFGNEASVVPAIKWSPYRTPAISCSYLTTVKFPYCYFGHA